MSRPTDPKSATPPPDPYAELRWLDEHPIRWATFSHGYQSGYGTGYEHGRRDLEADLAADWARMREWLQLSRHPESRAQLDRRRSATSPALTPEEIRDRAESSWAEVERRIRKGAA